MPAGPRPRRDPTDDWNQLRLLVASPAQEAYELLRPIVLFGQSIPARARETAVPERTLRRKVARFAAHGMRSLFDADALPEPTTAHRLLPADIRRAIVELKAEYPPFGLRELATICRHRFDRPVSHHTVRAILTSEPLPIRPPRRFPRYHEVADSVVRRRAIVTLYLDGWSAKAIAGYLATSRQTVHEVLRRWDAEGWPGLADRPLGPRQPARKVDLRAMAAFRRLQANPELGEFRIHAALAQQGIYLSPRTCGRILALHRALGAPKPAAATPIEATPIEAQPMPFAAQRRHQYWSVDGRYVEDHRLGTGKPVYLIAVLENFSQAILASAVLPRQDLTAYLVVLRAAIEAHGAPEVLVSDGGAIFRAKHAQAIYAALGIRKAEIDPGQAWQNYIETHCNVVRRMADDHVARAATWADLFRLWSDQRWVAVAIIALGLAIPTALFVLTRRTLGPALQLYARHALVFLPASGAVVLVGVLSSLLGWLTSVVVSVGPLADIPAISGVAAFAVGAVQHVAGLVLIAPAAIYASAELLAGRRPAPDALVQQVRAKLGAVLRALFRPFLVIGLIGLIPFGSIPATYATVQRIFIPHAVLLDAAGPEAARSISVSSVHGRWWRTAALSAILAALVAIPGPLIGILLLVFAARSVAIVNLASSLIYALVYPLIFVATTIYFLDRRASTRETVIEESSILADS